MRLFNRDPAIWLILSDGSMQMLTTPTTVDEVLRDYPGHRLWSTSSQLRPLPPSKALSFGHTYQLLPVESSSTDTLSADSCNRPAGSSPRAPVPSRAVSFPTPEVRSKKSRTLVRRNSITVLRRPRSPPSPSFDPSAATKSLAPLEVTFVSPLQVSEASGDLLTIGQKSGVPKGRHRRQSLCHVEPGWEDLDRSVTAGRERGQSSEFRGFEAALTSSTPYTPQCTHSTQPHILEHKSQTQIQGAQLQQLNAQRCREERRSSNSLNISNHGSSSAQWTLPHGAPVSPMQAAYAFHTVLPHALVCQDPPPTSDSTSPSAPRNATSPAYSTNSLPPRSPSHHTMWKARTGSGTLHQGTVHRGQWGDSAQQTTPGNMRPSASSPCLYREETELRLGGQGQAPQAQQASRRTLRGRNGTLSFTEREPLSIPSGVPC